MLGAGTVINPIIKIVTTVAILAAVYFFIVKPVLDTTGDAFNAVPDFSDFDSLSSDIQDQVNDAFDGANVDPGKLRHCIQAAIDAGAGEQRIRRCVDRFGS